MKTRFIRINDISEIDPSKASVYDLGNRYIDNRGNMYGLKYNRLNKKIEIIKIIRTPAKTAPYYQQKVNQKKKTKVNFGNENEWMETIEEIGSEEKQSAGIKMPFNASNFINSTLELMKTHKERLNGIAMNIRNSKIVTESDRMELNTLEGLLRNIEIDGTRRIEKILENQKELISFPRSLSYYQSRLNTLGRKIFDSLSDDERKMKFIYCSEMHNSFKNLYNAILKVMKDLQAYLDEKDIDEMKHITHLEKQSVIDAKTSLANTIKEISKLLNEISLLEEYISKAENF